MKCENLCLKMVRRSLHKLSSAYVPDFTVSMYFAERVSMISYVCVFLEKVVGVVPRGEKFFWQMT